MDTGTTVRLTQYTHDLGRACKLWPQDLEAFLAQLTSPTDPAAAATSDNAQISGGLLISLPATRTDALLGALRARGVKAAACVGRVTEAGEGMITVEA